MHLAPVVYKVDAEGAELLLTVGVLADGLPICDGMDVETEALLECMY